MKKKITLEFDDSVAVYQLLNAIFAFKHGDPEVVREPQSFSMFSDPIYSLSEQLNDFLEDEPPEIDIIASSFRLNKNSDFFPDLLQRLKYVHTHRTKIMHWNHDRRDAAEIWIRRYFAPLRIDEEVIEIVINELNLIR